MRSMLPHSQWNQPTLPYTQLDHTRMKRPGRKGEPCGNLKDIMRLDWIFIFIPFIPRGKLLLITVEDP
jgi:hypothetical protein